MEDGRGQKIHNKRFVKNFGKNLFPPEDIHMVMLTVYERNTFLSPATTRPPRHSIQAVFNICSVAAVFAEHYYISSLTTVSLTTWTSIGDKEFKLNFYKTFLFKFLSPIGFGMIWLTVHKTKRMVDHCEHYHMGLHPRIKTAPNGPPYG